MKIHIVFAIGLIGSFWISAATEAQQDAVAAPSCADIQTDASWRPSMYYGDDDHGAPFAKDPSVVRFLGRYWMYYSIRLSGRIGIGIATSDDLTEWRKAGEFEAAADYEKKGVAAPAALVHEGKVHLFYQTYGNGPKDALCHAFSEDGLHFERNRTNPIFAPTGSWTVGRAIDAEVYIDGDTALLYAATRDPEMNRQMLTVASAPVSGGFARDSWTQRRDAPILEPELPWETKCIEAPSVLKRDGRFFMFYAGGYNNDPQQIGAAVSIDGVSWERLSKEPLLPNGPEGAWNHSESGHPGVFVDENGETWLFFQGNNDKGKTWFLSKMRVLWDEEGLPYLRRLEDGYEFRLVRTGPLAKIQNPLLDLAPKIYPRDPLLVEHEGAYYCYYTAAETRPDGFQLHLDEIRSTDLANWSAPRRLLDGPLGFSSPGSMIRWNNRWIMALQSYPIPPGETWADDSARLWIMESDDLERWDAPRPIKPDGCTANWARSRRQIDPCIVAHEDRFWCFYKTDGQLGLLTSSDLHAWEEALPERPVLNRKDAPDGAAIENVSLIQDGDEWLMFFSPCRDGRGIGVARSSNLLDWRDIRYLDFPTLAWADNGPTAPMALDQRRTLGVWLMAFHGERRKESAHGAALGLAWSRDLHHWVLP